MCSLLQASSSKLYLHPSSSPYVLHFLTEESLDARNRLQFGDTCPWYRINSNLIRFDVLRVLLTNSTTLWGITACRMVDGYRQFVFMVPVKQAGNYFYFKYRICSRNLRTFFSILAAEKSGCVKYEDFFLWRSWSGFYSSITENTWGSTVVKALCY